MYASICHLHLWQSLKVGSMKYPFVKISGFHMEL